MPDERKSSLAGSTGAGSRVNATKIRLFFVDLELAAPFLEAEEEKSPRLSDADLDRAAALSDREARRLWRATRIATRIALEPLAGKQLRRVAFRIEGSGRPVVPDGSAYFSVSHTGTVALIAVAREAALGIDLERKDRTLKMSGDRRIRIAEAASRLTQRPPPTATTDADVLAAWVGLEAAAKALGIGIGRLLTEEGVVGGGKAAPRETAGLTMAVKPLAVGEDYVAAIAASSLPARLTVEPFPHASIATYLSGSNDG